MKKIKKPINDQINYIEHELTTLRDLINYEKEQNRAEIRMQYMKVSTGVTDLLHEMKKIYK